MNESCIIPMVTTLSMVFLFMFIGILTPGLLGVSRCLSVFLNLQIFMRPEFALEDPATFNAVLPWSHFNSAGGKSSRDVASSKLLQEKVS